MRQSQFTPCGRSTFTMEKAKVEPAYPLKAMQDLNNRLRTGRVTEDNVVNISAEHGFQGYLPTYSCVKTTQLPRFEFGQMNAPYVCPSIPYIPLQYFFPYSHPNFIRSSPLHCAYKQLNGETSADPGISKAANCRFDPVPTARNQISDRTVPGLDYTPQLQRPESRKVESYNNNAPIARKIRSESRGVKQDTGDPYLNANYKYRNVFKAIIRRMHGCIKENKSELISAIQKAGYTQQDIERAFNRIAYYKNAERKSGKKRMSVRTIKEATQSRSVYTYVLRVTLNKMLEDWSTKKLGRLSERNVETYSEVCTKYSQHIEKLLNDGNNSQ